MVQLTKGLLCNHESLSSVSRTHIKVLGMEASACNHRTEERREPCGWLATQVTWLVILSPVRNLALNK